MHRSTYLNNTTALTFSCPLICCPYYLIAAFWDHFPHKGFTAKSSVSNFAFHGTSPNGVAMWRSMKGISKGDSRGDRGAVSSLVWAGPLWFYAVNSKIRADHYSSVSDTLRPLQPLNHCVLRESKLIFAHPLQTDEQGTFLRLWRGESTVRCSWKQRPLSELLGPCGCSALPHVGPFTLKPVSRAELAHGDYYLIVFNLQMRSLNFKMSLEGQEVWTRILQ